MSDRVVYKGKIYGNTLATRMTTVLQEPDEKEDDGTYMYIIPEDEQLSTVQIAGGGRVKYGSADSHTVICQGLKMTKKLKPITTDGYYTQDPTDEIKAGLCMPTDLYTNFDLDFCSIVNNDDDNTQHGPIRKNYSIICPVTSDKTLYLCLDSKDKYKTNETVLTNLGGSRKIKHFLTNQIGPIGTTALGNYLGYETSTKAQERGLLHYADVASISTTPLGINKNLGVNYAGVYFLVNEVHGVGDLYGWNNKSKKWEIKYQNGYAEVLPFFIQMREFNNRYPGFYITGTNVEVTLPKDNKIPSYGSSMYFCRYKNGQDVDDYDYFYYDKDNDIWIKKEEPIISIKDFCFLGDAQENPLTSTVPAKELKMNVESLTINVREVYSDLFEKEITNGYITIEEVTTSESAITELVHWSWNSSTKSFSQRGNAAYLIKQENNNFTIYTYDVITPLGNKDTAERTNGLAALPVPFKNKAELNFALGIREELQYIDENTYMVYSIADKIVNEHNADYWDDCPEKYKGQLQMRLIELYSQYVAYNSYDYNNIIMTFDTTSIEDAVNKAIINALVDKVLNTGTTIDDIEKIPNLPQTIIDEVKSRVGGNG